MKRRHSHTGYRRFRLIVTVLAVLAILPALYLWWLLLSPFGYESPPGAMPVTDRSEQQVFVYGTLRNPVVRWLVVGRRVASEEALLPDYRKQALDIVHEPGAETPGEVVTVRPGELRRLDRYERLGIRYERVEATLDDGRQAWVYRRLPQEPPPQGRPPE